jgi:hypothetical protein
MDSVNVSVTDQEIEDLATALDGGTLPADGTLPAANLLRSLVDAIRAAAAKEQPVTVTVQVVESLQGTFDNSFTPEPQADAAVAEFHAAAGGTTGKQVNVRFMKIGRLG